jgi:hypothetical protein
LPIKKTKGISALAALAAKVAGVLPGRGNHVDAAADKIGRHGRQSIVMVFGPAVVDRHGPAINKAGLIQALMKGRKRTRERPARSAVQETDHRHRRLLCVCRERQARRRASDKGDKFASFH